MTDNARRRVLVITGDPIGIKLAGPAIRAWNIAEALSADNEVTLVSLTSVEPLPAPFALVHLAEGSHRAFAAWEQWADVILFQGHAMDAFPAIETSSKIVVVDIYDPMHLEQLEQSRELPLAAWNGHVEEATISLNKQLVRGDFFLCASERQRTFYLGQLAALGRLNPANYAHDPDLDELIAVVPFGLSRTLPPHERDVLKGVLDGVAKDDKLLLWSGGLYNWFDPKTLIAAVGILSERRDSVRLFFQGTKHPHPGVPEMAVVRQSRALAAELGLADRVVFFNGSWVDYADRHNYLLEADAGVSTHFSHLETTFSFRTRILDYLWAGLPMVVTEGDVFAELVEDEGLGLVVKERDAAALADALERVLFDEEFIERSRANVARVREDFYWDRVLEPLVGFVSRAHRSADAGQVFGRAKGRGSAFDPVRPRRRRGVLFKVSRTLFYLRNGGPAVVLDKIKNRLAR
jgi:glycosyltransferase involved in cell wall biosynthesis